MTDVSLNARVPQTALAQSLKDALIIALVTMALAGPIVGLQTVDVPGGLALNTRFSQVAIAAVLVFFGRLGLSLSERGVPLAGIALGVAMLLAWVLVPWPEPLLAAIAAAAGFGLAGRGLLLLARPRLRAMRREEPRDEARLRLVLTRGLTVLLLGAAVIVPLTPIANSYVLDTGITILIYLMLAWGLNIVVGLAGLLDLGYVAFYAVGAYTYALLSTNFGWGFWGCLPLAGLFAASFGLMLGFPVLRLRGDYLAIVTLGFGEIIRIVLLNWVDFSGGPNGINGIPRVTFFGHPFTAGAPAGTTTFAQFFGISFSPLHRQIFFFYLILVLALIVNVFTLRIRKLPVGRAWEALREDEIACKALGINPTNTKLTAFTIGAMFAGFAGAFFATKQAFISPESFTFIESAMILAIVVLGGMGSQLGVALAAVLVIGLTEGFRQLESYRMIVFGLGMVAIMIWRPSGLLSHRDPTIRLAEIKETRA